jgi:carboxypeptidase C (cathepsin A)
MPKNIYHACRLFALAGAWQADAAWTGDARMQWMVLAMSVLLMPSLAEAQSRRPTPETPVPAAPTAPARPAPTTSSVTHQTIVIPGNNIAFTAAVEAVILNGANAQPQAQSVTTAFLRDNAEAESRPVTFVFNGGPGTGSAWLDLGALGPWRVKMTQDAAHPSADITPVDNAETWLDFTDLVFIDPPGTGYARLLVEGEEARKRFWSVNGDIDAIAETIRLWLANHHRMASPKYVVGESYGGFRGPRVVRTLAMEQGVGVRGLVLISPLLEFGTSAVFDPLSWVWALPSEVAAVRARKGPVSRADLADVEEYAAGDYLVDVVRGPADPQAVARRIGRVATLTGLDAALLRARRGQINNFEFSRTLERETGRVTSLYDLTVSKPDAFPAQPFGSNPDAMMDDLRAPMASAMADIYDRKLNWHSDTVYEIENQAVERQWDYGNGPTRPQSFAALRTDLAADPGLHVLVAHGLFDLVTPYFRTKVMLDQIEPGAGGDRLRLIVLPGGHMFYSRDESRVALRDAARAMYLK